MSNTILAHKGETEREIETGREREREIETGRERERDRMGKIER